MLEKLVTATQPVLM